VPAHPFQTRAGTVFAGWFSAWLFLAGLVFAQTPSQSSRSVAGPSVVKVLRTEQGFQLTRNGQPYAVRGVGGSKNLELLAQVGGNSIRTWGTENLQPLLDEAHRLGLTVSVGIWLGHERHGFNYNDPNQVARQIEQVRADVLKYKDHPALLLWGLGNEMEGLGAGDNAAIWSAINNLAAMVKQLDPNHPTMTVVAEIGGARVSSIHRLCPDIDIVGINSYGGVPSLPKRYREAGGSKPFLVTEFGPPGMWEVTKTAWGSALEPTSTAKAEFYRNGYQQGILQSGGLCLGAYAFLWGNKQEGSATWFGMLLPTGERLAAVDAMQKLWTGKEPANLCPRIEKLSLSGDAKAVPGSVLKAALDAVDPEGKPLHVKWVLQAEPAAESVGGDAQEIPPTFPEALSQTSNQAVTVALPEAGGAYRLFAYVFDQHNGAAVANVPLYVDAPVVARPATAAELPLIVYDEASRKSPAYFPTGWMGNHKSLKLDPECRQAPHSGETCLQVRYEAPDNWVGVVWQHPAQDWGDRPGGWNLSGAKKLTFWARGDAGGEVVSIQFGLLATKPGQPAKKFPDSATGKLEKLALTRDWKMFEFDLQGLDLSRIKTGFSFVLTGQAQPVVLYLDDIRYE